MWCLIVDVICVQCAFRFYSGLAEPVPALALEAQASSWMEQKTPLSFQEHFHIRTIG